MWRNSRFLDDWAVIMALSDQKRNWRFSRSGGVYQVVLRDGADIAGIDRLDQKLWMALAVPIRGIEFDARTAELLDADKDGYLRPPEIIAAVKWAQTAFNDLGILMRAGDAVRLDDIRDKDLLAAARRLLAVLGKNDAGVVCLADVAQAFAQARFNGDGIIHVETAADEPTRRAIAEIIGVMGAVNDQTGRPGLDREKSDAFFAQSKMFLEWSGRGEADPALAPLGLQATEAAFQAVQAVAAKVEDYFTRCRLVAFDMRAQDVLNREAGAYAAFAGQELSAAAPAIAALPLARVESGKPLPLSEGVNPAWMGAMDALRVRAVVPLLGAERTCLTEADWHGLRARLRPFETWLQARPNGALAKLGVARLRELYSGAAGADIAGLIERDLAAAQDRLQFEAVEKLARIRRDLYKLLANSVNFADFYGRTWSLFQFGTLYLDARACHLCVEVVDVEQHARLAGLSGAFLAYCSISRASGQKKNIAAVFTAGNADNLMVGRNGVFYDRCGLDWNATIIKIISNPISVREAFWSPYKKLIRLIDELIARRARTAESNTVSKISGSATTLIEANQTAPRAVELPKKIDLGAIALIGTAIGGVSALVGGVLQAVFGLGLWLPLGLVGLILLISGPSMLLAWFKLRQRNLGPILDANGWAVNTRAVMNVPFGAALTECARLPPDSEFVLTDQFIERRSVLRWWLLAVLAGLLFYFLRIGAWRWWSAL